MDAGGFNQLANQLRPLGLEGLDDLRQLFALLVAAADLNLVLGDGRNNYNLPHEWVLRDIQQRAKQVIWLNPENRMTWGFGDSEMDRYAPYCTMVEECRNLGQLYRVIDRIVTV